MIKTQMKSKDGTLLAAWNYNFTLDDLYEFLNDHPNSDFVKFFFDYLKLKSHTSKLTKAEDIETLHSEEG